MAEVTHGDILRRVAEVEEQVNVLKVQHSSIEAEVSRAASQAELNTRHLHELQIDLTGHRESFAGFVSGAKTFGALVAFLLTTIVAIIGVYVASQ